MANADNNRTFSELIFSEAKEDEGRKYIFWVKFIAHRTPAVLYFENKEDQQAFVCRLGKLNEVAYTYENVEYGGPGEPLTKMDNTVTKSEQPPTETYY